jgi:hypothetical protein
VFQVQWSARVTFSYSISTEKKGWLITIFLASVISGIVVPSMPGLSGIAMPKKTEGALAVKCKRSIFGTSHKVGNLKFSLFRHHQLWREEL